MPGSSMRRTGEHGSRSPVTRSSVPILKDGLPVWVQSRVWSQNGATGGKEQRTSYSISSSVKGGICSGGIQTIFPSFQTTMLRPARRCSSKARATPRRTPMSIFRSTSSCSTFFTDLPSESPSILPHHTPRHLIQNVRQQASVEVLSCHKRTTYRREANRARRDSSIPPSSVG